jgi:hypothetical protein
MEQSIQLKKEGTEGQININRENVVLGGGAVNSVNGQTGDVVLTTSDLDNTSDYQTGSEVEGAISQAISGIDIPDVVQSTGTSTTDVMSQNATTSMVFQDPSTRKRVQIGDSSSAGTNGTAIGSSAYADTFGVSIGNDSRGSVESVVIGRSAVCLSRYGVAIGNSTNISSNAGRYSVALGWGARTSRKGEVNVGTGFDNYGFNDTKYRVIGGVHDGIDTHDATTVGQVNTRLGGLTLLPITQTDYDALTTKDPNTLYVITGA